MFCLSLPSLLFSDNLWLCKVIVVGGGGGGGGGGSGGSGGKISTCSSLLVEQAFIFNYENIRKTYEYIC